MSARQVANSAQCAPGYAASASILVQRWRDDDGSEGGIAGHLQADQVAEEVPVALEYNGISHAVMLASPLDLEDFALGFSLSEAILAAPDELYDCDISALQDGIRVRLRISAERFAVLKAMRRNLLGRTGCGLCGAETLQQAIRHPAAVTSRACFDAGAIHAGLAAMARQQALQRATGATHAAAWLSADGQVALVREDVGRHNALDKLLGALARKRTDFAQGAVLISSRASYEMVQKTATLGIGMLAAISGPTGLALRLAEDCNITLMGFVREHSHVVYTHPQRLNKMAASAASVAAHRQQRSAP
jgi:FdhD protein